MGVFSAIKRGGLVAAGLAIAASPAAWAQQPMPPEAAQIAHCLCLERDVSGLSADMKAKSGALAAQRERLDRLNTALSAARSQVDVNSPESVARFKQLLQRHDDAFRQANGPAFAEARAAVAHYNAAVGEYNTSCANHPWDADLMKRVQATLSCPAP